MALQYIADDAGRHTAVIIPIKDWNSITNKYQDLKDLIKLKVPKQCRQF